MTAPISLLLVLLALVVSACTRLNAVLLGHPVSMPYIGIVAVLIALALAAMVLVLLRLLIRDGLRLRPRVVVR